MRFIYKITLSIIFLFHLSHNMYGQRFGANPSSVKWKKIRGKAADIVFPNGADSAAMRVNAITQLLENQSSGRLGNASLRIPIVLQTLPTVSNAYVGLGPWRSEFFLFPPQDALYLGSTSWLDNLSVHEYRHVHQYANFRKGLSKFAYLVAGQEGQALANSASVPDWFFEGDAVYTETKYLSQGRGRLPGFFDPFRSLWLANKKYGYQKLRSGSMKDLVPNHYALGYLLVAHGYRSQGDGFWAKVTDDAARFKGLFYPLQSAIKRHAGVHFNAFVERAIDSFRLNMPVEINYSNSKMINELDTKRVVDHRFPIFLGGDSVLALRRAYNQLAHWVIFSKGKASKLGIKNIGVDDYYTYKGGNIVYAAYSPDPRWQWKENSDIILYNIYDRTEHRVTKGKRYFSPDLSNDGQQVIAVDVAPGGKTSLDLINRETGERIKRFESMSDIYFSYPVFSQSDSIVYVISRKGNGASGLLRLDIASGSFSEVLPYTNAPMSFLRIRGNKLMFTISQGQTNQFWEHDLLSGKTGVLAVGVTGSYAGDIHEDGNKIVYSSPSAEGEQVYSADYRFAEDSLHPLKKANEADLMTGVNASAYPITDYKKSEGLFRIHSWRPFYEQPEWSFSLYGQNLLNTMVSSYDYVYNENEGSHRVGVNLAYGGLYPWITGGTNYTMNRTFRDSSRLIRWNEWTGNVGLRLPLNFTSGKLYKQLDLSTRLHAVSVDYDNKNTVSLKDRFIPYLQHQVSWAMQTQQAIQHIYPRFAFVSRLQSRMAIGNTNANQLFWGSQLYLPGVGRNHSLVLGFNYQSRDTMRQYSFSNGFAMARGYEAIDYPRMWRTSFNYHMPLLYPDLGIGNIVYFLRVRSNFFYDDMHLKSLRTGKVINLRSAGTEVYFDTKWWNQQNVTFGLRYSRLLDTKLFVKPPNPNRFEFIMPINLLSN